MMFGKRKRIRQLETFLDKSNDREDWYTRRYGEVTVELFRARDEILSLELKLEQARHGEAE